MSSVAEKVSGGVANVRERRPFIDHVIRMVGHYGDTKANLHAGAVTYFAFLSFFPLLALTFFAVGVISTVYPDANAQLRDGIDALLPNLIGQDPGQISLTDVRSFSGIVGLIGLVGVLYTGLGFIQVLREALTLTFDRPMPTASFVKVKALDLLGLVTIGGTLLLSIAVGTGVTRFSDKLLDLIGLADNLSIVLSLLGLAVSLVINSLLFYIMFWRLVRSRLPNRALWSGALLGGIGFEVLKQAAAALIALTKGNPAFQAFGIALTLIVIFNYFARLTLYAASWAYTAPEARAQRGVEPGDRVHGPQMPSMRQLAAANAAEQPTSRKWVGSFAAGGAAALGLVAMFRRNKH